MAEQYAIQSQVNAMAQSVVNANLPGINTTIDQKVSQAIIAGGQSLGAWNAATNTPTLTTTPSAQGTYYIVSVGGTRNITGASVTYKAGDYVVSNGTKWDAVQPEFPISDVIGTSAQIAGSQRLVSQVRQESNSYFMGEINIDTATLTISTVAGGFFIDSNGKRSSSLGALTNSFVSFSSIGAVCFNYINNTIHYLATLDANIYASGMVIIALIRPSNNTAIGNVTKITYNGVQVLTTDLSSLINGLNSATTNITALNGTVSELSAALLSSLYTPQSSGNLNPNPNGVTATTGKMMVLNKVYAKGTPIYSIKFTTTTESSKLGVGLMTIASGATVGFVVKYIQQVGTYAAGTYEIALNYVPGQDVYPFVVGLNGTSNNASFLANVGITNQIYRNVSSGNVTPVEGQTISLGALHTTSTIYMDVRIGVLANVSQIQQDLNSIKEFKLLAIGNSYARDAYAYVPYILKNMNPNIKITMAILYVGSSTLEQHWTNIQNNSNSYAFDIWNPDTGVWSSSTGRSALYGLQFTNWDIVTMQQQSGASSDYNTYQPYLNNIIDWIYSNIYQTGGKKKSVRLGWLLTPAPPGNPSDTTYNLIAAAAQRVFNETAIDFVIQGGTAIQNARTTSLGSLGVQGNMSFDGLHLQEGVCRQVEAYACALEFSNLINRSKSIYGDGLRVDNAFVTSNSIPRQPNGDAIGSTDANCIIAQKCALAAVKKPYVVTTINY